MATMATHQHEPHLDQPVRRPDVGLIAPPDLPPERILEVARAAETAGLDDLWLWEDCFASSGVAPAAAVLGATQRLRVGIGILPAPLRAPSLTAMEIATLARMFPHRFRPGLGHGVLDWMGQAGVRVPSPLTLLREHLEAVRDLLAGERVTRNGRYVHLEDVQLRWPPPVEPELFVGARGPKTLALAGELADGVILDDAAPEGRVDASRVVEALATVREARERAGRTGDPHVVAFLPVPDGTSAADLGASITALGEAGATVVAAFATDPAGPPAGDERVLALAELLRATRSPAPPR